MRKVYLVTGGAGFIGSNIVEELVRRKEAVKVIDSFITGKKENIRPFLDKIELVRGDIRSGSDMKKALKGVDIVLHQAAFRSVPKSVEDPELTNDVNVTGTLNVLLTSKNAGVERLVYASSSSVYGDAKTFPQKEDQRVNPISPYAVSKLAAENYCSVFNKIYSLQTVSLRYFNVFGPRQNPESKYSAVIPAFISVMLAGRPPVIDGTGKQLRDFTYVKNVVEANIAAAHKRGAAGQVINIACGRCYPVSFIVEVLNRLMNTDIEPVFGPKRAGDVFKTNAGIARMRQVLGISPSVGFVDGLSKTLEWFKSRR